MKSNQFEELEGKSGILLNKMLDQLRYTERVGFQSLVHTNLGVLSKYCLKPPTTFNNLYSIIISFFTSPKFKNTLFFASLSSQPFVFFIPIDHQQHTLNTMSSKSKTPTTKQTMNSELQETSASVPKMVKPITTVPLIKFKRKTPTKSSSKKKKLAKSKMGTTESSPSMDDVYENENPLVSVAAKPNVGTSEMDSISIDVEATTDAASSEVEKGKPKETPVKKLGLEESNVVMDNPEDMSVDDPILDNVNVVGDLFQPSLEKSMLEQNVF